MRKITTDVLTLEEVAAMLKVKTSWLYQRTCDRSIRGGIPHFKLGKLLGFDKEEVMDWFWGMHRYGRVKETER
jgi:predicted DNA-binding transcriptional regulator AlpA